MFLLLLVACTGADPLDPDDGLLGDGLANPFPSAGMVVDGHLALPELPYGETPIPVDRLAWRTGFSPGQGSVIVLDGVDPAALPAWREPTPGEGGVVMVDLDTGEFLPVMAELDAWPDQERPALLIRPQVALAKGHRIAVAVTTAAAPRPERYQRVLDGDMGETSAHHQALLAALEALGVDDVAVAWDFPVSDGSAPLRSVLPQVAVPTAYTFTRSRDVELGDKLSPHTWRAYEGTFDVQDFLRDDRSLDLQGDGTAALVGSTRAFLYVHIPLSARDAAPGSAPVLIFGHGIFGHPSGYLDTKDDAQQVALLAEELGAIVVATTWRGLEADGRLEAIEVAGDFGKFPLIPERLVQGHANVRALIRLVQEGELLDDPRLSGASGQKIGDPSRLLYYGISLGGIEGTVLMAQDSPVQAAVLHVPGGVWSTMLERSTQWPTFELFMAESIPEPADRQLLYAVSQLWWDPVDPVNYVEDLEGKAFLLQESLGDEQVPNMTTRTIARSAGLGVLAPPVEAPWGMAVLEVPLGPGSSALAQFDPEVGVPADVNRPPGNTRAHSIPRTWPGTRQQARDFLGDGQLGTVTHHCGSLPCSASNPGADE